MAESAFQAIIAARSRFCCLLVLVLLVTLFGKLDLSLGGMEVQVVDMSLDGCAAEALGDEVGSRCTSSSCEPRMASEVALGSATGPEDGADHCGNCDDSSLGHLERDQLESEGMATHGPTHKKCAQSSCCQGLACPNPGDGHEAGWEDAPKDRAERVLPGDIARPLDGNAPNARHMAATASPEVPVSNPSTRSDSSIERLQINRESPMQNMLSPRRDSQAGSHDSSQPQAGDSPDDSTLSLSATGSSGIQAQLGWDGLDFSGLQEIFKWLGPYGRKKHPILFTPVLVLMVTFLYAFMAGVYPVFLLEMLQKDASKSTDQLLTAEHWRPADLTGWVTISADRTFPFDFLLGWGGRYGPKIDDGDWWRWFTSPLIHQSFQHVLGNMTLLATLAAHLEHNHGTWRIVLVYLLSSVGGNLMSAAFEDGCVVVVGSSGAVFGFVGLFAGDAVLNFDSMRRPLLRIGILLIFVAFFIVTTINGRAGLNVSHFSHLGGLLCGLFPPFLFLPNLKRQQSERTKKVLCGLDFSRFVGFGESMSVSSSFHRANRRVSVTRGRCQLHPFTVLGVLVLLLVFIALPIYLYLAKFPSTVCKSRDEGLLDDLSTTSMACTGWP